MKKESGEVVFLIRMWQRDAEAVDDSEWRGSVDEIGSGLRYYVTGARDIADFITARLAEKNQKAR
jgi:hypothetical protein